MRDQLDRLLASYADAYDTPTQNRISELQSKFMDTDFEGLHIGAPDQVDPDFIGLPTITLAGTKTYRFWDVDIRRNSVIVACDLERAVLRVLPLFKPPAKKEKALPKAPKPADADTESMSFGAHQRIVGEGGNVEPGTYSLSVIEWDRVSNIRSVVKKANPGSAPIRPTLPQWPWEEWKSQAAAFQAQAGSPKLDGDIGLAVDSESTGEQATLLASFGTRARPIHIIASAPGAGAAKTAIRAAVPVDLLQFTLDKTSPERHRVLVPIYAAGPVKPGDPLKGWFSYPLSGLRRKDETLIYVFVDGMRSGPWRIPALRP